MMSGEYLPRQYLVRSLTICGEIPALSLASASEAETKNKAYRDVSGEYPACAYDELLDTGLLTNWHGNRDRVNRWMLHTLGSDERQAKVHHQIFQDLTQSSTKDDARIDQNWSRLVLKYWFLDEGCDGSGNCIHG